MEEDEKDSETECHEEEQTGQLIPYVTHTVVFKCIGSVRDADYQNTLRVARDLIARGETVPVRVNPEPTNIKDARALVFECEIDKEWKKVGYVVKEVLEDVRSAINKKEIFNVKFDWIKYITDWTRSGPGYFAVIRISKNGDWGPKVTQYSSTR